MKLAYLGFFLIPIVSGCVSGKEVKCFKDSKTLINNLYYNFPVNGSVVVENSDFSTLNVFFSSELTKLLLKDQKCRNKISGICNIDFSIITHNQDVPNKYKILQEKSNIVTVKLEYPQYSEFLDYIVDDGSNCLKIKNIKYDNETNLLKILSN